METMLFSTFACIFGNSHGPFYRRLLTEGAMATDGSFKCEVEESGDRDKYGNHVTTVKCHGRVASETSSELKNIVRPLIDLGRCIIVDLGDVSYLDSSGLGTLVGLKVSAINKGRCKLEFRNMAPRVLELLRITKLTQILLFDDPDVRGPFFQ